MRINRGNWRVWASKLYTCIDLKKFDEAVQACMTLIDLRAKSEQVPLLEEKCIRAIVSGSLVRYHEAEQSVTESLDKATSAASFESARRTLNRVNELVSTLVSAAKASDAWIYQVSADLHKTVGLKSVMMEELMKQYRALQSHTGWETNDSIFRQMCRVIDELASLHIDEVTKTRTENFTMSKDVTDALKKFRFLLQGVVRKVRSAFFDQSKIPFIQIEKLQGHIQSIDDLLQSG